MKNNFTEGLNKAETFLKSGNYNEAVERSFKVLENCLVLIYEKTFNSLKLERQLEILNDLKDNFKAKKFDELMIGEKLRIFENHKILEGQVSLAKDVNPKQLLSVNTFRVEAAHDKRDLTKGEAIYSFGVILRFIESIEDKYSEELVIEDTISDSIFDDFRDQDKLVLQNLPPRDYTEFIGRENKIKDISKLLLHDKVHVLSIDGIGGVGKSALALEVAYKLFSDKVFDAMVWVSAKRDKLTYQGIVDLDNTFDNLEDLFDAILNVFKDEDFIKHGNLDTKKNKVIELLKENRSLLIVDNLETINDDNLKNFLIDINFPIESKVLITSRKRLGQVEHIVYLEKFNLEETSKYVISQLKYRSFNGDCSEKLISDIHLKTGGIPLAIKVIIPWIIEGKITDQLTGDIDKETDILKFCFETVYKEFLSEPARKLFAVLSLAPSEINEAALRFISEIKENEFNESLNSLINYSLIFKSKREDGSEELFSMLPLTQEFGKKIAAKDYSELKNKINKSYLKFIELSQSEIHTAKRAISINKAEEARRMFLIGKVQKAEILFKESIEYDDECDFAKYLFAIFAKEKQDFGRASSLIERAIKLNDSNATYWIEYASILESMGDYKKTEKVLEMALTKTSNDRNIVLRLCLLKTKLQKNDDVISIVESSIVNNSNDKKVVFINTLLIISLMEAYWRISYSYIKNQNKNKAHELLLTAVYRLDKLKNDRLVFSDNSKLLWEEKKTFHKLGDLAVQLKNYPAAKEYYSKALYDVAYFSDRKKHNDIIEGKIQDLK